MVSFWHSPQAMKLLAAGLVAMALAGIVTMHVGSQKAIAIQGPGALQVINEQTVWLGVNDDLWILDAAGHKTGQRTAGELGLSGAASNIALAPGGQALMTSRADPNWQVVNVHDLTPVRRITPQWPDGFKDKSHAAIHVAVSPNWDIAVATGGGHAVLLFDKDGKYKRQTRPGTYYFTNGLWHGSEGWWTTDTNRGTLRLLDTETLDTKTAVELTDESGGYDALGELVASRGNPLAGRDEHPIGTVSRLGFLMEPGHAVDVFADGRQATFNREPLAILRDMAWLGRHLLVVDGGSYQVLRFDADRIAQGRFGDNEVNATLQKMLADRLFWMVLSNRYAFLLAAMLLLAGIAAYARHKKLAARVVISARPLRQVGTPRQRLRTLVWQRLWIFGLPVALRFAAAAGGLMFLLPLLMGGSTTTVYLKDPFFFLRMAALSILLPLLVVAAWQQWRHARLSAKAGYEATLNHKAMTWLDQHGDWDTLCQSGETPRETIYMPGWKPRWVLITNQRILLFAAGARERRLQQAWPRQSVLFAGSPLNEPGHQRRETWRSLLLLPGRNFAIQFSNGDRLAGRCASALTATRSAGLLMQTRSAQLQGSVAGTKRETGPKVRRRWHEVVASFAIPGLGQWLQDRFVTGTVLFTAGALLCLLELGPVIWAATGPKMHVNMMQKTLALLLWFALALTAALDAFHFSATRKPVPGSPKS